MAKSNYEQGASDWKHKGRLDAQKAGSSDYRKGAQDQRTKQVDDALRSLGRKGGKR
jgi:hypothetical protein